MKLRRSRPYVLNCLDSPRASIAAGLRSHLHTHEVPPSCRPVAIESRRGVPTGSDDGCRRRRTSRAPDIPTGADLLFSAGLPSARSPPAERTRSAAPVAHLLAPARSHRSAGLLGNGDRALMVGDHQLEPHLVELGVLRVLECLHLLGGHHAVAAALLPGIEFIDVMGIDCMGIDVRHPPCRRDPCRRWWAPGPRPCSAPVRPTPSANLHLLDLGALGLLDLVGQRDDVGSRCGSGPARPFRRPVRDAGSYLDVLHVRVVVRAALFAVPDALTEALVVALVSRCRRIRRWCIRRRVRRPLLRIRRRRACACCS